ncbi:MAG: hypothetical protein MJ213_03555 [Bacilli bacterium]|nr:hypothetical protein [Bacilli bacterium]
MVFDDKKFTHCLRTQIYPDKYADERIKSILKFALKYDFKNIILMFNGEEFNSGHLDVDELKPWVEVIKKAKLIFAEHNISTSINPWFEFGQLDRGRTLKENQRFTLMVDKNGKSTKMVACPLDKNWREFYLNTLSYYVSEVKPEVLWIEDDFRLHNHDPLEWGGCFCENHIALINQKLNKNLTREEIVNGIISGGEVRKAWLESSWYALDSLAKLISSKVKEVSPSTSVALMSSRPEAHQMEGRHWKQLLTDLSSNGYLTDRIHLPCYNEISPKQYLYFFNENSMIVRAFIGDEAYIYPEMENSSFSLFSKSPKFLSFQLESALPLGLKGMTYDIFEFVGNGAQNEFKYGEAIKKVSPYLDAVKELNLKPSELLGLTFPIDEMSVLHRKAKTWYELIPDEQKGVSYFSSLGFSFRFSTSKEFHNESIVLTGQNVNNFSNDEIISLFKDNFIILDGESAKYLIDRGLGYLIKAKSYVEHICNDGTYSFEVLNKPYKGMHQYRGSLEKYAGNYVLIDYEKDINVLSNAYNYSHEKVGPSFVKGSNFIINPYIFTSFNYEQFGVLKDYLFTTSIESKEPLVKSIYQGLYVYLFNKGNQKVLFLSNACGDFSSIDLLVYNLNINKITLIQRNGERKEVKFRYRNNRLKINSRLSYLNTSTFIIE